MNKTNEVKFVILLVFVNSLEWFFQYNFSTYIVAFNLSIKMHSYVKMYINISDIL